MSTFTQQLAQARRRALIAGRPISSEEVAGITAGQAEVASARAARLKAAKTDEARLALDEKRAAQEKELALLAERRRQRALDQDQEQFEAELAQEHSSSVISGAVTGATAGASVYGIPGAVVGGVVGAIAGYATGGSHICTAANYYAGLDYGIVESMDTLMQYCKKNRKQLLGFYINTAGPSLIWHMRARHNEVKLVKVYKKIRKTMLLPIHNLVRSGQMEEAAALYAEKTLEFLIEYKSVHAKNFKELMKNGK